MFKVHFVKHSQADSVRNLLLIMSQVLRRFSSQAFINHLSDRISCIPTGGVLGGIIYDFNFQDKYPLEIKYELNRLLLQHQLLIFRDSDHKDSPTHLDDKSLVELTKIFGNPLPHQRKNTVYNLDYPEIFMISNLDKFGNHLGADYLPWHSDLSYMKDEGIGRISILHSIQMEPSSFISQTSWMNCYETYDKLSTDIKDRLSDYIGMHRHPNESNNPDDTLTYHAVIKNHSVTKKPVLYISPHFTRYIFPMDTDYGGQSVEDKQRDMSLRNKLFEHSKDERFVYTHTWKLGDILIWDNECTQHSRPAFDGDKVTRVMKRTQIYGPNSRFMVL